MDKTANLAITQNLNENTERAEVAIDSSNALTHLCATLAEGEQINWRAAARHIDVAELRQIQQIEGLMRSFGAVLSEVTGEPQKEDKSDPVAVLAVGTTLAHYRIVAALGRGAYGQVYKAIDLRLKREVALKLPNLHRHSAFAREDLLREGQHMARVDHPNVLRVLGTLEVVIPDLDPTLPQIVFVCELMQGENLEHWLQRQGVLGSGELRTIAIQLCAGVAALHASQIVHADLKPANVLRHSNGHWVIADFGSSQSGREPEYSSGTPHFMAPEQFTAGRPSMLTDQYALGALLFRLATGRYPFEAANRTELKALHERDQRLRLLDLRPDLPQSMIDAIERALRIEPDARFESIGALCTALGGETDPRPARRRWRRWALLAAAVVVPPLGVIAWTHQQQAATIPNAVVSWTRSSTLGLPETLSAGATVQPGDTIALNLELSRPTYVYVINEDSFGMRFQLFPLDGFEHQNPLPPGSLRLPGKRDGQTQDWRITSRGGRERFYVVFSPQALPELSQLSLAQAGAVGALAPQQYAEQTRGVGGIAASTEQTAPESPWLQHIQQRYPNVKVTRFEVMNP